MFKRIIKDDKFFRSKDIATVPINKKIQHPVSLKIIDTNGFLNPICLTKMYISNNKLNDYGNYICNGENKYKENIQLPPIAFNSSDLLEIYNINTIDSLKEWIDNIIQSYEFLSYNIYTIIRIISCWITENSDTLSNYKKPLQYICYEILKQYSLDKEVKQENINDTINKWIDNYKNGDDIDLLQILIKKFTMNNK